MTTPRTMTIEERQANVNAVAQIYHIGVAGHVSNLFARVFYQDRVRGVIVEFKANVRIIHTGRIRESEHNGVTLKYETVYVLAGGVEVLTPVEVNPGLVGYEFLPSGLSGARGEIVVDIDCKLWLYL